jgi:hypothetical protein
MWQGGILPDSDIVWAKEHFRSPSVARKGRGSGAPSPNPLPQGAGEKFLGCHTHNIAKYSRCSQSVTSDRNRAISNSFSLTK